MAFESPLGKKNETQQIDMDYQSYLNQRRSKDRIAALGDMQVGDRIRIALVHIDAGDGIFVDRFEAGVIDFTNAAEDSDLDTLTVEDWPNDPCSRKWQVYKVDKNKLLYPPHLKHTSAINALRLPEDGIILEKVETTLAKSDLGEQTSRGLGRRAMELLTKSLRR